jgi:NADH dehydrogenase/NADH:ubiquinone oxidoreductase subunit G
MVEIWIDDDRVEAEEGQTVMQAARASGHEIP